MRELGIPTVVDRFIQQAMLQILQPIIDPTFSPHSYGFRPGKSAHQALKAARNLVLEGRRYVVDVDLEKFFDRVNHDILVERHEGTPQGGPLSPLLANVLLDEVDKALEKRGHAFVRYADDCNVYVGSRRAGLRVMAFLHTLYGRLKLKVNESKSAVDLVTRRKLLGYTMEFGPNGTVHLKVAPKTLAVLKDKVRMLTRRNGGRSIQKVVEDLRAYLPGWKTYFALAKEPKLFRALDEWIRHRMRQLHLKHWRRGTTAFRELTARGVPHWQARNVAAQAQSWWRTAGHALNAALPTRYFDSLGVPRLG
jgi:hypothetical protein